MKKSSLKVVAGTDLVKGEKAHHSPKREITRAFITEWNKQPPSGKDEYIQDLEIPGFKLRRTRKGTIVFLYQGRVRGGQGTNKGKLIKRTLGRASGKGAMTVSKARTAASELRDALAMGMDPLEQMRTQAEAQEAQRKRREAEREARNWTPAYALQHMIEWRASRADPSQHLKPKTVAFYQRGIANIGRLAKMPIVDIRADDIRMALDRLKGSSTPAKSKRALSGVITHAINRLDLDITNPVSRLDRGEFKPPVPRCSYLRREDIPEFIEKILTISIPGQPFESKRASDYLMLTLMYGTRKNELMQLRWDWFDWNQDVICLPANATKQKRKHLLPLTDWTRPIMRERLEENRRNSPFVFPGNKRGQPLTNVRRSLIRAVGKEFKLHDARRTLITHCVGLGIDGTRLKAIVGHARTGVTENYDQRDIDQVREDLTAYHKWLHDACEERRFEDIVKANPEDWPEIKKQEKPPVEWPGRTYRDTNLGAEEA